MAKTIDTLAVASVKKIDTLLAAASVKTVDTLAMPITPIGTPTLIASQATTSTTTTVVPITTNMTAGNKLILWARGQSSKVISSIADTQGNSWHVDVTSATQATQALSIAECQPAIPLTTADTVTITWSSSTSASADAQIFQVAGLISGIAFDKTSQATTSGTNTLSAGTTATLSQANELAFAGYAWNSANSNFTAAGGFTAFTLLSSSEGAEWKIVAATTALSPTATTGNTPGATHGLCATFKGR